MLLSGIGESGLIELFRSMAADSGTGVEAGIGDDAAVLRPTAGRRLLATCDLLLEGVHFNLDWISPGQLGHRALAASLSDIAAMGGVPRWALLSLGFPPSLEVDFITEMYDGLLNLARACGVSLVGGDTCRSPGGLLLDITVLGEAEAGQYLLRSGARPGDLLAVTGSLGDSAAGLAWLQAGRPALQGRDAVERALSAHFKPLPRLAEGRALAGCGAVTAMDDISDGLASEAHEIAVSSGVAVRLWRESIPVGTAACSLAASLGQDSLDWALRGGEDYELVCAVRGGDEGLRLAARALAEAGGAALTVVGEVLPGGGVTLAWPGGEESLPAAGYNHFAE